MLHAVKTVPAPKHHTHTPRPRLTLVSQTVPIHTQNQAQTVPIHTQNQDHIAQNQQHIAQHQEPIAQNQQRIAQRKERTIQRQQQVYNAMRMAELGMVLTKLSRQIMALLQTDPTAHSPAADQLKQLRKDVGKLGQLLLSARKEQRTEGPQERPLRQMKNTTTENEETISLTSFLNKRH